MNLGFEEIKEGRKITTIKFIFKKTRIHKVINQKTGAEKNFYEKPVLNLKDKKSKKVIKTDSDIDVLEGQLGFKNLKNEAQPIQNILSKLLKNLPPKI
jgi:plasmid replication initiation protein